VPGRRSSDHLALQALLRERNQLRRPDDLARIDAAIRGRFERPAAVLALDMCGFSRLSARHGVIPYLAMIAQMADGAGPAVVANGGRVVKQHADDLLAAFPSPEQALEAALDIRRALNAMNAVLPADRDMHVSIGIGFGPTLVLDDDLWGCEVNVASKLGEDLAGPDEILLTAAAHAALAAAAYRFSPCQFEVSGMRLDAFQFERKTFPADPA